MSFFIIFSCGRADRRTGQWRWRRVSPRAEVGPMIARPPAVAKAATIGPLSESRCLSKVLSLSRSSQVQGGTCWPRVTSRLGLVMSLPLRLRICDDSGLDSVLLQFAHNGGCLNVPKHSGPIKRAIETGSVNGLPQHRQCGLTFSPARARLRIPISKALISSSRSISPIPGEAPTPANATCLKGPLTRFVRANSKLTFQ